VLSRSALTPIRASVEGQVRSLDGPLPALRELTFEADRNLAFDARGLPRCPALHLLHEDIETAASRCPGAILGRGEARVGFHFPEDSGISATTPLVIYNGGEKDGVRTLYVHAFITIPTPAAFVSTVKVSKVAGDRYGLKAVAAIPKIAGGHGAIESFKLTLGRRFIRGGEKVSVLSARCRGGRIQFRGTGVSSDEKRAQVTMLDHCAVRRQGASSPIPGERAMTV
jgi:hypothetical protein